MEVRVSVSVLAQAFDADKAPERTNVPAELADHSEMWLMVSDVPPFVHTGAVPLPAFDPPDAAAKPCATRVVEPAAALFAPAAPGSPVCSLMYEPAIPVKVVPADDEPFPRTSRQLFR
jgi:hypothetical protein